MPGPNVIHCSSQSKSSSSHLSVRNTGRGGRIATVRDIGGQTAYVNAGVLGILALPAANLASGIQAGDHILLAIRPEHIAFAPSGVAGELVTSTFLGERSHFHIRIPGRSETVAVSGTPPSGAVHLAFDPEKLIGLPADR